MCRTGNNSSTGSACGGARQGLDPCRSEQQVAQDMCVKPSLWQFVLRVLNVQREGRRGLQARRNTRQVGREVNGQEACQAKKSGDSATQVLQRLPRGQVVCIGSKENKQSNGVNGEGRAGKTRLNPTATEFVPAASRALHSPGGRRVSQKAIEPRKSKLNPTASEFVPAGRVSHKSIDEPRKPKLNPTATKFVPAAVHKLQRSSTGQRVGQGSTD